MMELQEELRTLLDPAALLTGTDVTARHAGWGAPPVQAALLVRPRDTAGVSAVLHACHRHGQAVTVHGGLTGLVGGGAAGADRVVLSLERMNRIEDLDVAGRCMLVQAGTPLETVQRAAEEAGLFCPLDIAARGSCTIGGNVATNAGGNRVIRYGMTRGMVLGLEAVLADGTVLGALNRLLKDNAGYDLKHLFIGSEGTLGVITRVVLRLAEYPPVRCTALAAVERFESLAGLLKHADRALGGTLAAFEVMWREYYEAAVAHPGVRAPLADGHAHYALIEALGGDLQGDAARFERMLHEAHEAGLLGDAVIARSEAERAALWRIRDDSSQVWDAQGARWNFDVSVPLRDMPGYVERVRRDLDAAWPDNACFVFGHLGDGNLHFMVRTPGGDPHTRERVEGIVYRPLAEFGGSVSAEHGIGLEKKPWLALSRSPQEIALMRTLKHTLDPKGILNPGLVFDN